MMTRRVDVFDPGVLTIGRISAGTTYNVIPETAVVEGTIRAVSESTRDQIHAGTQRVAEGVAAAHDLEVEVGLEHGYPVTVNDPGFATFAAGVASKLIGGDRTITLPHPVMGAEDFSYVLDRVPGTMMFLGATPPGRDPRTAPPNHSNRVTFDDRAMSTGIALHTAVALEHLS